MKGTRRFGVLAAFLVVLAFAGDARAGSAYDEFRRLKSPEIERQACALARWAVKCRLDGRKPGKPPMRLHRIFSLRGGVFVTLLKNEQPRGCMGTIEPVYDTVAREIIENAAAAATADTRRRMLSPGELAEVTFHLSIPGRTMPASGISDLRPNALGLLVRSSSGAGILLPGEARTAAWQMKECRRKAGLPPGAPAHMYVFKTVTLDERRR